MSAIPAPTETEPNNTSSTADPLETYSLLGPGYMNFGRVDALGGDPFDFYYVDVAKPGIIELRFTHASAADILFVSAFDFTGSELLAR
jgi:hypothetical protein